VWKLRFKQFYREDKLNIKKSLHHEPAHCDCTTSWTTRITVRSPTEASIGTGEGAGPPSYIQCIPGNIFAGVQRPGIEVDNKNGWSHNFTPPYAYVLCIRAMVETHLGLHKKCPLSVSTIKQNCTVKFQSQCTKESLVYGTRWK